MSLRDVAKKARALLKKAKRPLLFYDSDTDGTTSYFQLKKEFPKLTGLPYRHKFEEKYGNDFQEVFECCDLVVVFDVPVLPKEFFAHFKGKKIIWADHHPTNDKELIKKHNVLHINPLNYNKKDNRPSSYLAYLVVGKKRGLFYAVMGATADFSLLEIIIDLYRYSKKEFSCLFTIDTQMRKELFTFIRSHSFSDGRSRVKREYWIRYLRFECGLRRYKDLIDLIYKLPNEDVLKAIETVRSLSPSHLNKELEGAHSFPFDVHNETMKEYEKVEKKMLKEEVDKGLLFFSYRGKKGFSVPLSEIAIYKKPEAKVIGVCFRKTGSDYWQCSFRAKGFQINTVVEKSIKGLDGNGGGHPFAAGARVHNKDFEIFEKRILKTKIN